jgi:hypothetical protein
MILTLKEELELAELEYLQDAWDKELVDNWIKNPSWYLYPIVDKFRIKHKIGWDKFGNLKRVPRNKYQYACVSRFVAAYLPKLSATLFATDKFNKIVVASILKRISQSKIDTMIIARDQKILVDEKSEIRKDLKLMRAQQASMRLVSQQRNASSRSNWSVTAR